MTRYRAVIEQAKGIVMLALAVTADEAFAVLRGLSQDSHVKVRDLAARLVDSVHGEQPGQVTQPGRGDSSLAAGATKANVVRRLHELTRDQRTTDPADPLTS